MLERKLKLKRAKNALDENEPLCPFAPPPVRSEDW